MNKQQSNYFNMGKTVCAMFNGNTGWYEIDSIAKGVKRIGDLCIEIGEESALQEQNKTPGYTTGKDMERRTLENIMFLIAMRLKVYAQQEGNSILAAQADFTRSTLKSMPLNKLLASARSLAVGAMSVLDNLEAYRITKEEIDILYLSIKNTEDLAAQRDAIRTEHTENTARITILISDLRNELKLMDVQVEAFITDESFLRKYFIARRIYDVRGGSSHKDEEKPQEPAD